MPKMNNMPQILNDIHLIHQIHHHRILKNYQNYYTHRKVLVDDGMLEMIFVAKVDLSTLNAFRLQFQYESKNKQKYLNYHIYVFVQLN